MPIDSEDKRKSVAGIPPEADGTISAADRIHIAGFYRGITVPLLEERPSAGTLLGVYNEST